MKRKLFSIGLICFVLGGACLLWVNYFGPKDSYRTNTVNTSVSQASVSAATVGSTVTESVNGINFEIVTTASAQQRGLGGRAVIPDDYGMLFVFPSDSKYGFWMKDMLTPIDMVWLSSDGTVVGITPSVSPATYPDVFYPPSPIRFVLETRAGFAAEKNWKIGTKIQLPLPY